MKTTRTNAPALTSPDSWRQTVARRADAWRLWTGHSGEVLSGQEVADHLVRARKHIVSRGWNPNTGLGIYSALAATSPNTNDIDTRHAASRLLDLILQARTGVEHADYEAWAARESQTISDVLTLLDTAAGFAREHGPRGGA
ncbi:DUF6197 family protein [Streptomyces sp. 4N509B]|uniref:DUF6197 family protein n=1 Tax=Streptomyces sp. 4N509B TaxID=3457413 RepID=UPI003FD0E8E0